MVHPQTQLLVHIFTRVSTYFVFFGCFLKGATISMYICIYVYLYICIFVYMYICIFVYLYICIFVYLYIFTLNNPLCRYLGNFENSFPGPENKKDCLLHGICTFLSLEISSNKNTELFRPLDATSTGDGSLLTKVHGCDAKKRGKHAI